MMLHDIWGTGMGCDYGSVLRVFVGVRHDHFC